MNLRFRSIRIDTRIEPRQESKLFSPVALLAETIRAGVKICVRRKGQ